MTLKEARALKAYIDSKSSINCTVPLGRGPDGYFPRSILRDGPRDWKTRQEFRDWLAGYLRERRAIHRRYEQAMAPRQRPRSPIELMIDRACGIA